MPISQLDKTNPETVRRKKDLDQVEPDHRPLALHCLKDSDTERPTADELCGRLASLKRMPMYKCSLEQSIHQKRLLQIMQQQVQTIVSELARVVTQLQMYLDSLPMYRHNPQQYRWQDQQIKLIQCMQHMQQQILQNMQHQIQIMQNAIQQEFQEVVNCPSLPPSLPPSLRAQLQMCN